MGLRSTFEVLQNAGAPEAAPATGLGKERG
jgi:hypothetical protein